MPSKKKKYNARFPPARIKKIMQMDEEVGKVAATVPVIISRALELFIESLIQQATQMTLSKNAKTLSASHLKHIIESEERYHFLNELVANISDYQVEEEGAPSTNHNTEEDSGASAAHPKKPRGRPRKTKDVNQVTQKKDRRKKKKESSSSESENSQEDTDDADEGTDEESTVPAASSAAVASTVTSSTSSTENFPSSSSATDSPAASTAPTTTTLAHPPPISELLAQSQEQQQQQQQQATSAQHQDATSLPVDFSQALQQQQQQQVALPGVSLDGSVHDLSKFQSVNAMLPVPATLPMYQAMPGVPATATAAAPHLFWPGHAGMLAPPGGGFPSLPTQGFAAGLGPPQVAPGFPGMLLPGLGLPAVSPSLMSLHGLPGIPFPPGLSPLTAAGFAGVSMAGAALAGLPSVAAPAATATNGAQADDDYDT